MPKYVLAVDDNDDALCIVGFALEHAGFVVHAAHNQREMQDALDKALPDLMVLDLMLPGVNGYEVLQQLQENAKTRDIPVIVVTAKSEPIYRRMSEDLGVSYHLIKPFHPDALVAHAQALLPDVIGG